VCHTEHVLGEDAQVILVRTLLVARSMVVRAKMVGIVLDRELATAMNLALCELSM
jgi:hypothetical protein